MAAREMGARSVARVRRNMIYLEMIIHGLIFIEINLQPVKG